MITCWSPKTGVTPTWMPSYVLLEMSLRLEKISFRLYLYLRDCVMASFIFFYHGWAEIITKTFIWVSHFSTETALIKIQTPWCWLLSVVVRFCWIVYFYKVLRKANKVYTITVKWRSRARKRKRISCKNEPWWECYSICGALLLFSFGALYLMTKERSWNTTKSITDSYWNKAIQFHCFSEQRQTHATFDWFIELIRQSEQILAMKQRAKKGVSDNPGLVDFDIGLVNSVFSLPDGQVMFFWGIRITEELWNQFCSSKSFWG